MQEQITIHKLIRSKRRTLSLEINPQGNLIVRAPQRASLTSIHHFVTEKSQWILRKQQEAKEKPAVQLKQYLVGEKFWYLGQLYPLEIIENQQLPLQLTDTFQLAKDYHLFAKAVFNKWYRTEAHKIITARTEQLAKAFHYHFKEIKISKAKTRWGSCSHEGNLNFNWRLVMAPLTIIDYVIAHELAHLKQMNHSAKFWRLVEMMIPDYKLRRKWLRDHQHELNL